MEKKLNNIKESITDCARDAYGKRLLGKEKEETVKEGITKLRG